MESEKSSASKAGRALSKKGASKGGEARAKALTPEVRREIARNAALARWEQAGKEALPVAKHWDRPLLIAGMEIPAYVLEDGRRVLVQRGMQTAIGMSTSGGTTGAHRMAQFAASLEAKGLKVRELVVRMAQPILFRIPGVPKPAYGYEARILADICEAVIQAKTKGLLLPQQEHFAKQCETLYRAYAHVGIIALVDEVTGFQVVRSKDQLSKILEAFVAKELRKWVKTFPDDYYEELFRLRKMKYPPDSVHRPRYLGKITNDIIYDRLAPGVLAELKRVTPRDSSGRHRTHLHRRLTEDLGHPRLREHLHAVVVLMRASTTWKGFMHSLNRALPRVGHTLELPLEEVEA